MPEQGFLPEKQAEKFELSLSKEAHVKLLVTSSRKKRIELHRLSVNY